MDDDFAALAHKIIRRTDGLTIANVAGELGISYHMLRDRLLGEVKFSPDEVRNLLASVKDPRLAHWLFSGTPFSVAWRTNPDEGQTGVLDQALDALSRVTRVIEVTREALADNRIDPKDKRIIKEAAEQAMMELSTLHALVNER